MSSLSTLVTVETINIAGPYLAYAGGAAAGVAVFLRNVLGSISDWEKLRRGRTVTIKVKGENVQIEDGMDIDEVLRRIRKSLGIDERTG